MFQQPHAELDRAAEITGVPKEQIVQAAEMLARPVNGRRPKTSFGLEKGNYWSNNYGNTASFAALALICGAGNRPGQVISRLGGHQRGWMGAAPYPIDKSPNRLPGRRRQEIDLDRWVEAGQVRFSWVIGTTWINAMAASQELYQTFVRMTTGNPHQVSTADVDQAAETLIRRADSGGMVIVDQDIYLQRPIGDELTDIYYPPPPGERLTSPAATARGGCGSIPSSVMPSGIPGLTGGSSPSSPREWDTKDMTGRTPTRYLRRHRVPAGEECWTTIPW